MKATRRALLASGLLGALAVVVGAFWSRSAERVIIAILHRRVGFLDVDRDSFRQFAAEYVARKEAGDRLARVSPLAPILRVWSPYAWLSLDHPLRRLEDNVVSNYLQSTDFFEHGANERRRVNYRGFFMVGDARCPNPFATTYYSRSVL